MEAATQRPVRHVHALRSAASGDLRLPVLRPIHDGIRLPMDAWQRVAATLSRAKRAGCHRKRRERLGDVQPRLLSQQIPEARHSLHVPDLGHRQNQRAHGRVRLAGRSARLGGLARRSAAVRRLLGRLPARRRAVPGDSECDHVGQVNPGVLQLFTGQQPRQRRSERRRPLRANQRLAAVGLGRRGR